MILWSALLKLLLAPLHELPTPVSAGFERVGEGQCVYQKQILTGLAALFTNIKSHEEAFQRCLNACAAAGVHCVGMTWRQCNHGCVVHGSPLELNKYVYPGETDKDDNAVDGAGNRIWNPVTPAIFAGGKMETGINHCAVRPYLPPRKFEPSGGASTLGLTRDLIEVDNTCDALCLYHTTDCEVVNNNHGVAIPSHGQSLNVVIPDKVYRSSGGGEWAKYRLAG